MTVGQVHLGQSVEQQPRQSALLRIGYTSPRGTGRGSRPWRGARRGTGVYPQYQYPYRGQQFTRGRRGWRGRGAVSYTGVQTPDMSYFRGLIKFADCYLFIVIMAVRSEMALCEWRRPLRSSFLVEFLITLILQINARNNLLDF